MKMKVYTRTEELERIKYERVMNIVFHKTGDVTLFVFSSGMEEQITVDVTDIVEIYGL